MQTLSFENPQVLSASKLRERVKWQAAATALPAFVLGYCAGPHCLTWVGDDLAVHAYASFEDRLYSRWHRHEAGYTVMDSLRQAYLVGVAVAHLPSLAVFDQVCGEVLHMQQVVEHSTIRLLRQR